MENRKEFCSSLLPSMGQRNGAHCLGRRHSSVQVAPLPWHAKPSPWKRNRTFCTLQAGEVTPTQMHAPQRPLTKQEASATQQPFWWAGLHCECQPVARLSCPRPALCPLCGSSWGNHRACPSCCDSVWQPKASNTYHGMCDGQSYTQ